MVMLGLLDVENKLSIKQLKSVKGGSNLSSALIETFTSTFKVVYEFGQNFGTSVRRIITKNLCDL